MPQRPNPRQRIPDARFRLKRRNTLREKAHPTLRRNGQTPAYAPKPHPPDERTATAAGRAALPDDTISPHAIMYSAELINSVIIIAVMRTLSAFFSGMEIAFLSKNRLMVEIGRKQSRFFDLVAGLFEKHPGQ